MSGRRRAAAALLILLLLTAIGCAQSAEAPPVAPTPTPLPTASPAPTATRSRSPRPRDDGSAVDTDALPAITSLYTVQVGETLREIAARYGLTATELGALNGLPAAAPLAAGRALRVPATAARPTASATLSVSATLSATRPLTYTIEAGDTLSQIAARFDISLEALRAANDIRDADAIYWGQTLVIPPVEE